ncbi:STAS domain-containing protein [Micromonospora sediminimaris]|uniref:Polyvinylalcohol dehydrogenase n=1 Tax=Micromonospora sediminimaris TaxID=547162 RepID=A0A9W5US75_9ACTN|nr:STAS domain-containing protein [Micromonospora sediminimaris]GIJ34081.1 polyvinylalcohol dehydrogenase [Micromonospora sediminimaris]SFC78254.1 rsbT co-antagonist protein RsbR [Micromonospora sediminimaris]
MALSADESVRLGELLTSRAEPVTQRWTETIARQLRGRLSQAELVRQVQELHRAMVDALSKGAVDLNAEEATELRAVLAEFSRGQARQGFSATETATGVFALKEALLSTLKADQSVETLRDYVAFSAFVDQMGLFTFETFVRTRESLIADQAEQLLELSTPVVKLWEGVVAVPLVGTLDSARAQVVMERLLQTLVDTGSPYAIIDITGVPAVDTQVAQHILKTVVAARLMGADCIISGIRPQIAQTIVALGIEFGDIATKASLADALRHVLRLTGVETSRRQSRREA